MSAKPETDSRASALTESCHSRLRRALEAYDKKRVLQATGVAEATLWRAVARAPLYRGTCLLIERGLAELERAEQAP